MRNLFLTIGLAFLVKSLCAQDLSSIKEQKPFDYSGSFSINQNAIYRNVNTSTSNPYTLFLNGNASFNIYGIAFPFSFSYSNQQVNYSQPFNFNQFGMQPSYKWIKTYIGYNTMSFSSYSLNGHQFLGGGIELTPPKSGLKFSAMYGRLIKPVKWDSVAIGQLPYYERYGFATKMGYSGEIGTMELSVFKAWDKQSSIPIFPDSINVAPKENMVYTVNFAKTFIKHFKLTFEYGGTALTNDTRQQNNVSVTQRKAFFLLKPNATTCYANAFKGNFNFLGNGFTLGIAYERVDPNYTTLGTYYTNNDLENIALTLSKQLFEGKLNLSGSLGQQKNNLDNSKISTSKNLLGSINASYIPGNRITLNANYSNYSYYTYMQTPFDKLNSTTPYQNIDTLNFTQISQTATLNSTIIVGSLSNKDYKHILSSNISYQQTSNKQSSTNNLGGSYFYQGSFVYSYSIVPKNLTLIGSILGSYSIMSAEVNTLMLGPVIGTSKTFFNKTLSTNINFAYNKTYTNGNFAGDVLSIRLGGSYAYQKVHKINFSFCFMNRNNPLADQSRAFELSGVLSYVYSLSKKN